MATSPRMRFPLSARRGCQLAHGGQGPLAEEGKPELANESGNPGFHVVCLRRATGAPNRFGANARNRCPLLIHSRALSRYARPCISRMLHVGAKCQNPFPSRALASLIGRFSTRFSTASVENFFLDGLRSCSGCGLEAGANRAVVSRGEPARGQTPGNGQRMRLAMMRCVSLNVHSWRDRTTMQAGRHQALLQQGAAP